jgi:predicted nucleic acid-binding protein
MIFVDANVPIYAVGNPHPLQKPCRRILLAAANSAHTFVTNAEVLQEVLSVLRRNRDWAAAAPAFFDFSDTMASAVLPVDHEDVVRAAGYVKGSRPGISTRDFVHLATMHRYGIERIVTADRDFDVYPDVTRLDPAALDEWADPEWFPKG